ncbi:hypothetical protein CU633_01080 [Bacillus sp. V3-13]|uniref:hypothetical protein n=1 Tax=Bacillus sp. V3-13 TaxID=2053728 RepID=UPI000C78BE30|nr:hypothetical protein [Bacillus sp. V3-13]PLR79352.1 hypothetical protein CU633_01080 [Bacillus sp. V3-13]
MIKAFSFLEDVSGEMKKRVTNNKKAEVFNSILIAQLGRSDRYKGVISGSVILSFALQNCILIYNLAGLRLVCVEYDPITVLNDFYLSNKFKLLQTNPSGKLLAYLKL